MLVDSHCHLTFPDFQQDLEEVLERGKNNGLEAYLSIGTRLNEIQRLFDLSQKVPNIFCSVGVHPHDAKDYARQGDLSETLIALAQHEKVIGLGETGLDYHYNLSPREDQLICFNAHIQASQALDIPIIIHTREADEDTLSYLRNQHLKGVFHCFSGGQALAEAGLDLGFYISFSGIITFKKSDALRAVVQSIPLERILIETDAPYLAPVPYRGQRNEPAFVKAIAECIAEVKGIPFHHVAQQTTENFYTLFKKAER